METFYAILASVVLSVLTVLFIRRLVPTSKQETNDLALRQEIANLRETKSDLEKRLAVEEQKNFNLLQIERHLKEKEDILASVKEGKATAEATLVEKQENISQLCTQLEQIKIDLKAAQKMVSDLSVQNASLQETLNQERKQNHEKLSLLIEAKESMTKEFQTLAERTMKTHGDNFSKQNKEQMDGLLTPLKEKIIEFQQGLQQTNTDNTKERTKLIEQIRTLSEASSKMTLETTNLTKALRGESQTQGAWGEMILSSILEKSGLREGHEYEVQQSHTNDDGQRIRSDVLVSIPGGQKIVIDSKVSLTAFEGFVGAANDDEREDFIQRHLTSMRTHIKNLGNKEYHWAAGSTLNYVVMFIPIEGALAAALQIDPQLTGYAVENNVAIATPTTLMMALRTVANVWQMERRNQNAEAIASRAGKIYDKLVGFVEDMKDIGVRLEQAQVCHVEAMSKLSSGRGNLINQVEQLKGLGARTNKSLPGDLIDETEPEVSKMTNTNEAA